MLLAMTHVDNTCPCGSNKTYIQCCQPLHLEQQQAKTAEQLMRSRFSAFYLAANGETHLCEYIINTWHVSQYQNKQQALLDLQQHISSQKYYSLRILNSSSEHLNDIQGEVEFVAFFNTEQQAANNPHCAQQLHERSRFIKEDGFWFYVDGDFCADIKLQRNDLCWCGSTKKLKKCHG